MLKYSEEEEKDMKLEYQLDKMREGMIKKYNVTFTIRLRWVDAISEEDAIDEAKEMLFNGNFDLKDILSCDVERTENE